jgi:hypothetical protein
MPTSPVDDPILIRFRQALTGAYGGKLERVVLFGPRARGDSRPDSDYDIAVLIDARQIATLVLAKVAARSAYYAAFHAAEAFIVERTSKRPRPITGYGASLVV